MKVGIIGVGNMGRRMAERLVAAGHEVHAYDPREEVSLSLPEIGAIPASSPAVVAEETQAAILMVLNSTQAEQAIWGEHGYAAAASVDSALNIMSSLPPAFVAETARRAEGRFRLVDSPVSGGVEGAAAGTLTIMASGDKTACEAVRPLHEALGKSVMWLGPQPGLGATMKAVNQAMYFTAMASAAEMVATAVKAGLDPDTVVDVVGMSSGDSWALRNRVPLSWRSDYTSGGALAVALKDMDAALELAEHLEIEAPITRAAAQIVAEAARRHPEGGDDPLIVEAVEARSGLKLSERTRKSS
ncbi:NAD-binding protein [Sinomonas notoginsengisoli]|uniref:NAD(P)-dependent oxidoreductase n=1 Tax=Sinomonas notoginsengisoli TaxID=1457311 RepID=UPI001F1943EE|nr:NAD(P)-dependent oxidoreductase [Sinomonas notoginsengisoli]